MTFPWSPRPVVEVEIAQPSVRLEQLETFREVFQTYLVALTNLVQYGPIGTNLNRTNELRQAAKFAYLPVQPFLEPYLRLAPNPIDHLVFGLTESWAQPELSQKSHEAQNALGIYSEHLRYLIAKSA